MPELTPDELKHLTQSLAKYDKSSVRNAIDAARDPQVAAQFASYLDESFDDGAFGDFSEIALCIALGEAGAVGAIPSLLRAATYEEIDAGLYNDAARYGLQRLGRPAFEAAMTFIAAADNAWERALAYTVLNAAAGAEGPVRKAVAGFCAARLSDEVEGEYDDEWHPGLACAEVLVTLRDPRVGPVLEERAPQAVGYQELLNDLNAGDDPSADDDWRKPWPELCAQWWPLVKEWSDEIDEMIKNEELGNELDGDEADDFDDADDEEEDDDDDEDPEGVAAARMEEFEALTTEFESSPHAKALPKDPADSAGEIFQFLQFGVDYVSESFSMARLSQVREVLYEWIPRKLSAEPEYFAGFPAVLAAYVRFLHDTGRLADPEPLLRLAEEAKTELPELAADPTNWGMAKSLFMQGKASGFDMTTEAGTQAFVKYFNDKVIGRRRAEPPAEFADELPPPVQSYRREAPKVGRNDPCPCGSGKKYKKCCGQ